MKKISLILAALLLMVTFASCSAKQKVLKVGIMLDFDSIPFIVAKQQGYMPKNIEFEIFKSPVDRDTAFYAGGIDGTISDVLAAGIALNGGKAVAVTSKTDGCYGVLTGEEIASAKDLEGKKIALSVNTIIEYVTDRIVIESGRDPDKVEKVVVPKIPSRLELLANKQIDAIAVPEPFVTAAKAQGAHVVNTSDVLKINPGVMLFATDALKDKSKNVEELYKAYNKAVDYISENDPSVFMPAVIEELGLPETAAHSVLPKYTHAVLPEEKEVSLAVDWLLQKGLVEKEYTYKDIVWKELW